MPNKLVAGIIIGLVIGVLANPLMPPAFFVVGGLAIWYFLPRKAERPKDGQE